MPYLLFALGLLAGAGAVYFRRPSRIRFPSGNDAELMLRLASLEDTVGYLTMKLEELQPPQAAPVPVTQARAVRQAKPMPAQSLGQVTRLAARGFDPHDISRELGMPLGQVDLVLRLHGGDD